VVLLLLLPAPLAAGDTPADRTDRHGDPLPAGAIARLGTTRLRHGAGINTLAFAPNGKTLAAGSWDGQISLWDVPSGKELRRILGNPREISQVAFSPDGKLLAFKRQGVKSGINLFNPATGKVIHEFVTEDYEPAWAFSPDGKLLAFKEGFTNSTGEYWKSVIYVCDPLTGKVVERLEGLGKNIGYLSFTMDGKALLVGTRDGVKDAMRTWDLGARKERWTFEADDFLDFSRCVLSADGKVLAFESVEGLFVLRDTITGKEIRRMGQRRKSQRCPWVRILWSPDGKMLAACGPDDPSGDLEGMVRLWDIATNKEVRRIKGPWPCSSAAFSPDGRVMAIGGDDHVVHLYEVATGKERPMEGGVSGAIEHVAISPDGRLLATASWDTIHLWDQAGKELSQRVTPFAEIGGWVSALAFTKDGKRLVSVSHSGAVEVTDVATAKKLLYREGLKSNWRAVGLAPDASIMTLGGDDKQWLLAQDVETGKTAWRLDYTKQPISCIALSPDCQSAAVVVSEGVIHLWDLKAKMLRIQIPGHEPASNGQSQSRLAFCPDGKTLASQRPKDGVQLWDVATGKERVRLKELPVEVNSIGFAPDGRLLACGSADGTIGLWDAATGKRLFHGTGHRGSVLHLAFSADSKLLLTDSADTTALLWDVPRLVVPPRTNK
jgi:WD40 repeat protein